MPVPFAKPVTVARPFLPPLENYVAGLEEIWERGWITNRGPVHQRFESSLAEYFATKQLSLFVNGTQALQAALEVLDVEGEVITTPFTFVATIHALHWKRATPVFVDVDPVKFNLDPRAVEAAITPRTTAILGVHIFGHPCDLNAMDRIAEKNRLQLIYDAAHAFGVKVDGRPLACAGDVSMVSLHATKVVHSIEGGLVVFRDVALKKQFDCFRDFGFSGEFQVDAAGTNAKMNELQALMGLQVLSHLDELIAQRQKLEACYRANLRRVFGLGLPPLPDVGVRHNYAYLPVLVDAAEAAMDRDTLRSRLESFNIFARQYFCPLVPELNAYRHLEIRHPLNQARRVSEQILVLPLHSGLTEEDVERVSEIVCHLLS